jgi:hypothetical protein
MAADKCGIVCKAKNYINTIKTNQKEKRARSVGLTPTEYDAAKQKAIAEGKARAQKEKKEHHFKEIQTRAYHLSGGKKGRAPSFMDQLFPKSAQKIVQRRPKPVVKRKKASKKATKTRRTRQSKPVDIFSDFMGKPKKSKKTDYFGLDNLRF